MKIKVLVNGAFGRMGQLVTKAVMEDEGLELVGQADRDYDLKQSIIDSQAEVVVDFTQADVVYDNTVTIIEAGARPIIGTSGLKKEQIAELTATCQALKRGGMIVPNFSIGAVLMMQCARNIAAYLPSVEIIEMHHNGKIDSPSGTALRTAQMIAEGRKAMKLQKEASNQTNVTSQDLTKTVENVSGARGALYEDVSIHSVRLSGVLAKQSVIFSGLGETLSISHESIQRESFMPGVVLACKKVMALHNLIYGLEEVL